MFGKQVVTLNKNIKEKLQVIENNVYRGIIGVGPTTPVETLRGEVGASEVESRVAETILMFVRSTLQGEFEDIKSYMTHDLETGKGRWAREVKKLEQEFELGQDELKTISKKELKDKIKEKDTRKWEEGLEEKETLKWYKKGKNKIGYDECYRNTFSSKLLARARTNTLQVEEFKHRRDRNHNKMCRLCGIEDEDLRHFMISCPRIRSRRNKELMRKWSNADKDQQLIDLLYNEKDYDKVRKMIKSMWNLRKDLLRPP